MPSRRPPAGCSGRSARPGRPLDSGLWPAHVDLAGRRRRGGATSGVVYAAAGIAHYDGTYVYALDAATGRVQWCNDSSGSLSEKVDCGVSLQGPLYLADGELRFLGGGKYETARYAAAGGKCLNLPNDTLESKFRTAFEPYFPEYGRYMSLSHALAGGKELEYDASYEGSVHSPLARARACAAAAPRRSTSRPRAGRSVPRECPSGR